MGSPSHQISDSRFQSQTLGVPGFFWGLIILGSCVLVSTFWLALLMAFLKMDALYSINLQLLNMPLDQRTGSSKGLGPTIQVKIFSILIVF